MFKQAQDALVTLLQAHLPPKVKVAPHGGRFADAELNRLATESPAIKVAILGSGKITNRGGIATAALQVGLFVITTVSKGGSADDSALALVSAILPIINDGKSECPAISGRPEDIRTENLYSGQLNSQHCALWVISYTLPCDLPPLTDGSDLDDFVTAVTTWGKDGPVDHVTLPPFDSSTPKDTSDAD